jgi:hypothetical protein
VRSEVGFMIIPNCLVALRYGTMVFTVLAWDCLGLEVKRATWLTAKEMSGRVLVHNYSNIPTIELGGFKNFVNKPPLRERERAEVAFKFDPKVLTRRVILCQFKSDCTKSNNKLMTVGW